MSLRTAVLALCASAGVASATEIRKLSFDHVSTDSFQHPLGYNVQSSTYLSIPMDLAPGEMIFTNSESTKLKMPPSGLRGYAITGFRGEIVDANNQSAPLSTVYDHHWIAVQDTHTNQLCGGSPQYTVGIGAESRNTADVFPAGYAYHVTPLENSWGANIHLLHTQGLAGDPYEATKECNECYYAAGKGIDCTPDQNGTFECCGDGCGLHECFCPVSKGVDTTVTSRFYLRYQVNYTYDIDQVTDFEIGTITTPDCALFYEVYENNTQPEQLSSTTFAAPGSAELIYAVGHLHTGSINISLYVNDKHVCSSYPRYGKTPGKAGDEYGYVVEMSTCLSKETTGSHDIREGDKIRLDAYYWAGSNDTRIYPHPGGTHLNVMAYMYLGYVIG